MISGRASNFELCLPCRPADFLLNPEVKNDDDLVAMANGSPLHRFSSMKIILSGSAKKYFKQDVEIRLYTVPSLARLPLNSDQIQGSGAQPTEHGDEPVWPTPVVAR